MDRAYSTISIKSASDANGKRTFTGIATTPSTDRMGDVVDPMGMKFSLPTPFLWQHDSRDPIGWVRSAKASKSGITVECEIASIAEPGPLKDRLDKAWQMLKAGLVRGLSIGFNSIEAARIEGTYGLHFLKTELLELSAVTIAANADCSITSIKSIDQALLAASGHKQGAADRPPPGASGTKQPASGGFFHSRSKGTTVKTLQEMREERNTKSARMTELVELFKTAGHEASEEETGEFDTLALEVKSLDQDIRIAGFHATQAAAAKGVDGTSQQRGSASRGGISFVRKNDPDDKFEGQSYIKMLKLKALSRLTHESVAALAEHRFGKSHPKFVQVVKASVAGGGTDSGEWGAELLSLNAQYEGDFIEYLYAHTLFDQLALTEVPANVRIKGQDGAATANWVGQSRAIPVSAQDFSSIDLAPLKVAALCVLSNELIEDSSPAADRLARNGLVEASSQKVDGTFFSTTAASSGVSPAGMLNGLTAIQASGTDEAAVRTDIQSLLYPFVVAKMASGIVLCMNPAQGLALGSMINTFSLPSFPGLNETGGMFGGRKVYAGDNVTAGQIIALRPQDIWKIGDGGVQVSMSDVATVEMNDAPAGRSDTPVAMASHTVSMFQTESTAFKVVRRINFQKRRSNAVVYIDNAEYGGVAS
jgi:HK97 family phage prohead protease/HK97 family phage major capsid protein